MGSLIFTCPANGRIIETGIETDGATYAKICENFVGVDCPHCAQIHRFKIGKGHLFKMQPRRKQIHSTELLCDEIDVGGVIVRSMQATASTRREGKH